MSSHRYRQGILMQNVQESAASCRAQGGDVPKERIAANAGTRGGSDSTGGKKQGTVEDVHFDGTQCGLEQGEQVSEGGDPE